MATRNAKQQNLDVQHAEGRTKLTAEAAQLLSKSLPTSAPMTIREFKVLQANLNKQREAQLSLLNDETLADFSLLLLSEPHTYLNDNGAPVTVPLHHPYWISILPSMKNDQWPAIR